MLRVVEFQLVFRLLRIDSHIQRNFAGFAFRRPGWLFWYRRLGLRGLGL